VSPSLVAVGTVAALYAVLALRERPRRGWSGRRSASFLAGCGVLAWALSPSFDAWAEEDFGGHAAQHLLLAMLGPLALVLGAPVTLLLRSLPPRRARVLGRLLHSWPVRVLSNAWVALLLSSGGLVALYLTPLHAATTAHEWVHVAVHVHLVVSGYLFAWVVAGPDPGPARPTVPVRLVVLGVAVAVHASVSQLLYAGVLVAVHEPVQELRTAGDLRYYGGDTVELLLALALLLGPHPRTRPGLRPTAGLSARPAPARPR
jgi:putative membrane protein